MLGLDDAALLVERRFLLGLGYRLTGSSADAEDIVQETFARALRHPPLDLQRPLRPYLVRIAVNLGRDRYRRRRRQHYVGPWLPWPLDAAPEALTLDPTQSAEDRLAEIESARYAFLVALEALTANARAVVVLRDVLDYSVEETASVLGLSAANVKTTHTRARRALARRGRPALDAPPAPTPDAAAALGQFMMALASGDAAAVEAVLTPGVRMRSDAGGQYRAALREVVGADKVARFFLALSKKAEGKVSIRPVQANGAPALFLEQDLPGLAPYTLIMISLDPGGRIEAIDLVLADEKLAPYVKTGSR